jgi:CRP/FNR family transcriptional regulator
MSSDLDTLGLVPLFRDLTPSQLSDIVSRFREDTFNQDAYIFYENDRAARLWIVRDGQVKIVKYGEGGREAVIEVISPGEVFGGAAMLMPQHPATAQALSKLTTLSLSTDQYKLMLQEQPAVAVRVIESLGHRLLSVIGTRMMASERVERRIAHILLKLASKSGVESEAGWQISISLSRQDIADLSDTTIETAIRVMSKFRKAGLVKTRRGGYVVILDPGQLREISGE